MKQYGKVLFVYFLLILFIGCSPWVKTNAIEEISPIIFLYFDEAEDGQLKVTTIIPPLRKEKKEVITTNVTLIKEERNKLNEKYFREMKSGQLRMITISKSLAQSHLLPILNTLLLDPEISKRLYLVVVEGDFITYLNNQIENQKEQIEFFLYKMFSHYEKQGEITVTNMHRFLESYFSPYADPILPLFVAKGNELTYEGTVLFRQDKMVDEITSLDDSLFQTLYKKERFLQTLPIPEKEITLGSLHSESQVTFHRSGEMHIQLELKGRVEEYQGKRDLSQYKEAENLKKELESFLEKQVAQIIKTIQKLKIDPLRIGEQTLTPFAQPYTRESWLEEWIDMPIHVEVNLQLESLGLIKVETP